MIDPPLDAKVMVLVTQIKAKLAYRCRSTYLVASNIVHTVHGPHIYVLANPMIPYLVGVDEQGEPVFGERPNLYLEFTPGGVRLNILRYDLLFRLDLDGSNIIDGEGILWGQ